MEYTKYYNKFFKEILKIKKNDLGDINMKNINTWDSVSHLQLISKLEEHFKIIFSPKDVLQFNNYKKGLEILKKKL